MAVQAGPGEYCSDAHTYNTYAQVQVLSLLLCTVPIRYRWNGFLYQDILAGRKGPEGHAAFLPAHVCLSTFFVSLKSAPLH